MSVDLVLVTAVVVITNLMVFLPTVDRPLVQALVGIAFVSFAPGYALVAALFPDTVGSSTAGNSQGTGGIAHRVHNRIRTPDSEGITGFERLALAFALSLALVPLLLVGLTYSPVDFTQTSTFMTISAATVGCVAVAAKRRWDLPEDQRFRVPYRTWIAAAKNSVSGENGRFDAVLNVALAAAILLAVGTLTVAVVAPPDGERFTEFYVLTEDDGGELVAANYPRALSTEQPKMVHIGIENYEQESIDYTVVIQLQRLEGNTTGSVIADRAEIERFSMTLGHNETSIRERALTIADGSTSEHTRLLFLLYIGDVPETPTRDNAYRNLHVWVE